MMVCFVSGADLKVIQPENALESVLSVQAHIVSIPAPKTTEASVVSHAPESTTLMRV